MLTKAIANDTTMVRVSTLYYWQLKLLRDVLGRRSAREMMEVLIREKVAALSAAEPLIHERFEREIGAGLLGA